MWKSHDPEVEQRLKKTYQGLAVEDMMKVNVDVKVAGSVGESLVITLR